MHTSLSLCHSNPYPVLSYALCLRTLGYRCVRARMRVCVCVCVRACVCVCMCVCMSVSLSIEHGGAATARLSALAALPETDHTHRFREAVIEKKKVWPGSQVKAQNGNTSKGDCRQCACSTCRTQCQNHLHVRRPLCPAAQTLLVAQRQQTHAQGRTRSPRHGSLALHPFNSAIHQSGECPVQGTARETRHNRIRDFLVECTKTTGQLPHLRRQCRYLETASRQRGGNPCCAHGWHTHFGAPMARTFV